MNPQPEYFGLRFQRGEWAERAACKGMPMDSFFIGKGEVPEAPLTVCPTCPVRRDCLRFALENDIQHGWYGGVSPRARQRMRPGDDDRRAFTLQQLWEMRERGVTYRRIAAETGLSESTVRKAIRRLRWGVS